MMALLDLIGGPRTAARLYITAINVFKLPGAWNHSFSKRKCKEQIRKGRDFRNTALTPRPQQRRSKK